MVALVGRYFALDESSHEATYVWYLATAPEKAFRAALGDAPMPKALGQASLDIAITHSFELGLSGRIGLHADTAGGSELLEWYKGRKMKIYAPTLRMPTPLRKNDGRYLYYTPEGAYAASKSLDKFRVLSAKESEKGAE